MSNQTVTMASSPPDGPELEQSSLSEKADKSKDAPVASAKGTVSEILESVSKATVAGLVVIYACGFVILSISNAQYGFSEVNPLRPRILGAGALFAFLTLLPMFTALAVFATDEISDATQRYARNFVAAADYMIRCNSLALSLFLLYAAASGTTRPRHWWETVFAIVTLFLLFRFKAWGAKAHQTHPVTIIIVGSVLAVALLVFLFMDISNTNFIVQLQFWLFGAGLFVVISRWSSGKSKGTVFFSEWSGYKWMTVPLLVIPLLFYFARVIYPLIQPSWGGGSPTRVIVYFSRDSRILPNQQLEADLVDESDSGMYIVKRGEKQAIFVPRQSVSALYFADKPLAPEFLKDVAPTPSSKIPTQPKPQTP